MKECNERNIDEKNWEQERTTREKKEYTKPEVENEHLMESFACGTPNPDLMC